MQPAATGIAKHYIEHPVTQKQIPTVCMVAHNITYHCLHLPFKEFHLPLEKAVQWVVHPKCYEVLVTLHEKKIYHSIAVVLGNVYLQQPPPTT